jgi:hypothetical protein
MMLANERYLLPVKDALDKSEKRVRSDVKYTRFGKFLIKNAGPEGNAPAPKPLHPKPGFYSNEVIEKWALQTEDFVDLAKSAHGHDLCSVRFPNPFLAIFKMNLADSFEILTVHTERHVRQIEAMAQRAKAALKETAAPA